MYPYWDQAGKYKATEGHDLGIIQLMLQQCQVTLQRSGVQMCAAKRSPVSFAKLKPMRPWDIDTNLGQQMSTRKSISHMIIVNC